MATVARTKQDGDEMTRQERLWDSLNHAYGQQREALNREYDKAISSADRQMTGRGMQRSSYGAQVRGNLNDQKIRAQDDSWNNQIAKYEEGLMTLDQQDAENERWEKQFNEGIRQFNESLASQKEENELSRAFQTSEREAQQAYQSGENALNRAFQTSEREAQQAWQSSENQQNRAYNTAEREAQQAYNTAEREAQQKYNSAENEANRTWQAAQNAAQQLWQSTENALNRQHNTSEREAQQSYNTSERIAQQLYNTQEREAQQTYQSGENALTRAENARQFNEQLAYNKDQAALAADQWQKAFDQENMTADQKLAASYVAAIAEQGGIPSDELLARAGLSRADAMAMRKNAKSSGSGGNGGDGGDDGSNPPATNPNDFLKGLLDPTNKTKVQGNIDESKVANWINSHSSNSSTTGTKVQSPNAYKDAFEGEIVPSAEEKFASSIRQKKYVYPEYEANVQSPDAYKDYFSGQINDTVIDPIEAALRPDWAKEAGVFADEYVDYDVDEEEKKKGITKTNNTIKSTVTKK